MHDAGVPSGNHDYTAKPPPQTLSWHEFWEGKCQEPEGATCQAQSLQRVARASTRLRERERPKTVSKPRNTHSRRTKTEFLLGLSTSPKVFARRQCFDQKPPAFEAFPNPTLRELEAVVDLMCAGPLKLEDCGDRKDATSQNVSYCFLWFMRGFKCSRFPGKLLVWCSDWPS